MKSLLPFLALALLASTACAADADRRVLFAQANPGLTADADNIAVRHYYPLEVGKTWSYREEISGEDYSIKVESHTNFAGQAVAKMRRSNKPDEYDLVTLSGALKLVFRNDSVNGAMDWSADPVPFSQGATVALGDKYEATPGSYTNPVTGGKFRWVVQIKRFEDVTVPAGTFTGCLRVDVKTVDTASGLEVAKFKMYLAPGVGMVKRAGRFITTTFKQVLTAAP